MYRCVGNSGASPVAQLVDIDPRLGLDQNVRCHLCSVRGDHVAHLLELVDRDKDEALVVERHARLVQVDHGEAVEGERRKGAVVAQRQKRQGDIVARDHKERLAVAGLFRLGVDHLAAAAADDADPDNRAGVLLFRAVEGRLKIFDAVQRRAGEGLRRVGRGHLAVGRVAVGCVGVGRLGRVGGLVCLLGRIEGRRQMGQRGGIGVAVILRGGGRLRVDQRIAVGLRGGEIVDDLFFALLLFGAVLLVARAAAAVFPAAGPEGRPVDSVGPGQRVDRVVSPLAQIEREFFAIERMLQILRDGGHLLLGRHIDADHLDRLGEDLPAADLEVQKRLRRNRRRHRLDHIGGDLPDVADALIDVVEPAQRGPGADRHVGEDPVHPIFHLPRKAEHHGVDDDHRRHAERYADDTHQSDVPCEEVPPGQKEFVHRSALCLGIPAQKGLRG